jgi:hypothetical protein
MIVATRRTRPGHGPLATATRRAVRAGRLDVTLAPSAFGRRRLPTGPVDVQVLIRFTPASAGPVPALARTLTATLPAAAKGGR